MEVSLFSANDGETLAYSQGSGTTVNKLGFLRYPQEGSGSQQAPEKLIRTESSRKISPSNPR